MAMLLSCAVCGRTGASTENQIPAVEVPAQSLATQAESAAAKTSTQATESDKPAPAASKEVPIRELYSEDGSATDSDGTAYNYSYHIPRIETTPPLRISSTRKLEECSAARPNGGAECVKNDEVPNDSSITYETYRGGTVFSLLKNSCSTMPNSSNTRSRITMWKRHEWAIACQARHHRGAVSVRIAQCDGDRL